VGLSASAAIDKRKKDFTRRREGAKKLALGGEAALEIARLRMARRTG
jgi:hypothetical protein